MNLIVRAMIMAVISVPNFTALASNESRLSPLSVQASGGTSISEKEPTSQVEMSFLQRQRQKLKERQAALAAAAKTTRYCAAPTYGRRKGKVTVINPGHCDTGGFGEHGEVNTPETRRPHKSVL